MKFLAVAAVGFIINIISRLMQTINYLRSLYFLYKEF